MMTVMTGIQGKCCSHMVVKVIMLTNSIFSRQRMQHIKYVGVFSKQGTI